MMTLLLLLHMQLGLLIRGISSLHTRVAAEFVQ